MSGDMIKWEDPRISHSSCSSGALSGLNSSGAQIGAHRMGTITQAPSALLCAVAADQQLTWW